MCREPPEERNDTSSKTVKNQIAGSQLCKNSHTRLSCCFRYATRIADDDHGFQQHIPDPMFDGCRAAQSSSISTICTAR